MDAMKRFEQFLEENPLATFSIYSHLQAKLLLEQGAALVDLLDRSFVDCQVVDSNAFNEAYGRFWLWTIGAYEMTRTLCQRRSCFSQAFAARAIAFKRCIAVIRMPFAKQELQYNRGPTNGEASVSHVDSALKDFGFEVGGEVIWMRRSVQHFAQLMNSLSSEDVVASIKEARPVGEGAA